MRILRGIGVVFLVIGLVVAAIDIGTSVAAGEAARLRALGEWWYGIHPDSLQVLQPAVQRHVSPGLWDHVIQPLLEWPAAFEALVVGAVATLAGLPWRRFR